MAFPERKIRGIESIRTLSGKGNQVFLPHKAYMRIACLEMEKSRRGQERASALARVNDIDVRIRDIDAEEAVILASLAQEGKSNGSDSCSCPPADPSLELSGKAFTLRY